LGLQRDLNGSVEEFGNLDHLGFLHRTGSEGVRSNSDSSGYNGGLVTGDGVLVERDLSEVTDLSNRKQTRVNLRFEDSAC
jgi:hypothetical protein